MVIGVELLFLVPPPPQLEIDKAATIAIRKGRKIFRRRARLPIWMYLALTGSEVTGRNRGARAVYRISVLPGRVATAKDANHLLAPEMLGWIESDSRKGS